MLNIQFSWHLNLSDDHANSIIELYNDVAKQESIIGYTSALNAGQATAIIKQLHEDLANKSKAIMLIKNEVSIIGMALLGISSMPNCKHRAEISKGIIHSKYRHQGLLPLALLEIANYSQSIGVIQLELDVRAGTRSEEIWRKAGFIEYGRLPNYARPETEYEEGIYMYQSTDALIKRFETLNK